MVADGPGRSVAVPGRAPVPKGTVLYRVLWQGYPPEIATWEKESDIHDDFITAYEETLVEEELDDEDDESDNESDDEASDDESDADESDADEGGEAMET